VTSQGVTSLSRSVPLHRAGWTRSYDSFHFTIYWKEENTGGGGLITYTNVFPNS